jgi:hypothetical protein
VKVSDEFDGSDENKNKRVSFRSRNLSSVFLRKSADTTTTNENTEYNFMKNRDSRPVILNKAFSK